MAEKEVGHYDDVSFSPLSAGLFVLDSGVAGVLVFVCFFFSFRLLDFL
jgi:hypothetical protein